MNRRQLKTSRKKSKIIPKLLILILLVGIFSYWKYRSYIYKPINSENNSQISFQIKQGESVKEIAQNLKDKELIKNKTAFYLHVKQHELGANILAGRFLLNQSMNIPEIIETLSNPSQSESILTIQEGLSIKEIDQKLSDLGLITTGEFNTAVKNFQDWDQYGFLSENQQKNLSDPLEGFIYPDTYFLDPDNFKPEDLITMGLNNFQRKIADINLEYKNYSILEIITMASIVENEVFGKEDRRKVAGLLWKRLENNWHIGADITLLYITDDRKITAEDLAIDSPYNTRKNLGLPPGPISNPSIESIEATLNPTETDYWFYLTTLDTGEVIYSKTNDEHNSNKARYLY